MPLCCSKLDEAIVKSVPLFCRSSRMDQQSGSNGCFSTQSSSEFFSLFLCLFPFSLSLSLSTFNIKGSQLSLSTIVMLLSTVRCSLVLVEINQQVVFLDHYWTVLFFFSKLRFSFRNLELRGFFFYKKNQKC